MLHISMPCCLVRAWCLIRFSLCAVCLSALLGISPARAEPWIEVGDRAVRSDLEILAGRGLIDGLVTTWPIPAGQMSRLSDDVLLAREPEYVRLAARRVLAKLIGEGQPRGLVPEVALRGTNHPDTIRDFGALARDKISGGVGLVLDTDRLSAGLRVNSEPRLANSGSRAAFDGSYLSALAGNWQIYGGAVDQWYGPGWTSSLILSNNARPLPKIGIMRNDPHAFETPWLSWIGPWQFNTFLGLLDGPRIDSNTILGGLRITFEPVRGLEVGLTRTSEICGKHHKCDPLSEFHVTNTISNPSPVNDEAAFDIKYNGAFKLLQISPYLQIMNESTGPIAHSDSSYLAGLTLSGPLGEDGARWRWTAEYGDTIATYNVFSFSSPIYGAAYNDYKYVDGMRYRGRTLGFSLDSDSRLFSAAWLFTSAQGWVYRLTYYRANVGTSQIADPAAAIAQGAHVYPSDPYLKNVVSAKPVQFDQVEAGISIPIGSFTIELDARGQDAQAYPETGGKMSGEIGLSYRL
jgi:hypothetical protein